jgi:ribosomal protein L11 methyltransferase
VEVVTSAEAEEAVSELLTNVLSQAVTTYHDLGAGTVTASCFPDEKPRDWRSTARALALGLEHIESCGLRTQPGKKKLEHVRWEDWAESWKRHFQPISIGGALLIKPGWSKKRAEKGQSVVVLDPGLSFGTGQHATTAFCLRQLVRCRRSGQAQSFLDMGTGSGILAIAAAKLRYGPVDAFDFDPEAVRIARDNALRNEVRPVSAPDRKAAHSGQVHIFRQDVARLPLNPKGRYSLICANLISNLLLAERKRIAAHVASDGMLVLAGILREEFDSIQLAYEKLGLKLVASRAEKEWRSGAFSWS